MSSDQAEKPKFAPKTPVTLDPPKDDPISKDDLARANGKDSEKTYIAIKGQVYDVTGNDAYVNGGYKIFAGRDASRALALSSLKQEDVRAEWEDLPEKEQGVLNDWVTFFSKRYNIVGRVSN